MPGVSYYTSAELKRHILDMQEEVCLNVIIRKARAYLNRALLEFRQRFPTYHRIPNLPFEYYQETVKRMCALIVYRICAQRFLYEPVHLARTPGYAIRGLRGVKHHCGPEAFALAGILMGDTDLDVEEIIEYVKDYRHEPEVPSDIFRYLFL